MRWANGLRFHSGEATPTCLTGIDRHYRSGLYRYHCLIYHLADEQGDGGTFTDLTGTLFDGGRLDIHCPGGSSRAICAPPKPAWVIEVPGRLCPSQAARRARYVIPGLPKNRADDGLNSFGIVTG